MSPPKTTPAIPTPWDGLKPQPGASKKRPPSAHKRSGELVPCNDPPPTSTLGPRTSKYTKIFESLSIGGGLKCDIGQTGPVANAMRTWIKKAGRKGVGVISVSDYGDGKGRVWLVKLEGGSAQ